jgi:Mn-dependent DtxR family transcriptional regulator
MFTPPLFFIMHTKLSPSQQRNLEAVILAGGQEKAVTTSEILARLDVSMGRNLPNELRKLQDFLAVKRHRFKLVRKNKTWSLQLR